MPFHDFVSISEISFGFGPEIGFYWQERREQCRLSAIGQDIDRWSVFRFETRETGFPMHDEDHLKVIELFELDITIFSGIATSRPREYLCSPPEAEKQWKASQIVFIFGLTCFSVLDRLDECNDIFVNRAEFAIQPFHTI
jgi:hypothetical protein